MCEKGPAKGEVLLASHSPGYSPPDPTHIGSDPLRIQPSSGSNPTLKGSCITRSYLPCMSHLQGGALLLRC